MKKAEHLATFFGPEPAGSPLAGVGPADVHNRDPREIPLVSAGAAAAGNGVLARAENTGAVFCQLVPYQVSSAGGALPSFSVVSAADAAEGKHCAQVTLGSVSGRGARLGQKVAAGEPGKTYTLAVFARALDAPAPVSLEIGRPAAPGDRLAKGGEVIVPPGAWTEIHLEFRGERR